MQLPNIHSWGSTSPSNVRWSISFSNTLGFLHDQRAPLKYQNCDRHSRPVAVLDLESECVFLTSGCFLIRERSRCFRGPRFWTCGPQPSGSYQNLLRELLLFLSLLSSSSVDVTFSRRDCPVVYGRWLRRCCFGRPGLRTLGRP